MVESLNHYLSTFVEWRNIKLKINRDPFLPAAVRNMLSRVQLIIKKSPKFYAHQTLSIGYRIRKKYAKINAPSYR